MAWRDAENTAQRPRRRGWRDADEQGDLNQITAFGRGLGDSVSLSFGDEIMGGVAGLNALSQGRDFRSAYDEQVERSRQNLEDAEAAHPWSTGAGQLLGYFAPGLGLGKIARTGVGLAGRLGVSAGAGAGLGAAYGAGSGETMEERLHGAAIGGGLGAAFGAGGQAVFGELAPMAGRGLQRWWRNVTGLPATASRGSRAQVVRDDLMTTARSNPNLAIQSEDDLVRLMNNEAARDPSRTVAEVMGQSGQGRLAYLARAPGQTGQRVEDFFNARAGGQSAEVEAVLLGRAPATGDALEQQLQQQWRTLGPQLYAPVLDQPLAPQAMAAAQQLQRSPLFQHRAVQAAWERAGAMIADDVALGRVATGAQNSLAHRLHYTKVALDDMIADPTKLEPGIRNMSNASISAAREQLLNGIERIIPGYSAARSQMADIGMARRLVQEGKQAFTRQRFATPEALARRVQSLSAAERPYFLAGVEEDLALQIMRAGRDGHRNIAGALLNDANQARWRAIFGQEADDMIARLREISGKFEFGQRVRPTQGSITSNVLLNTISTGTGAGAGALNNRDDPIMGALQGGALGFGIGAAARMASRNALRQYIERGAQRQRDMLGQFYMTPVGQFDRSRRGLLSTVSRLDRRRAYRTRLERTKGAYSAGAGGMGVYNAQEDR